jgi:hypothetical protein
MPKIYYFYHKNDTDKESIGKIVATNRLSAAKYFAAIKRMSLKQFLSLFSISR